MGTSVTTHRLALSNEMLVLLATFLRLRCMTMTMTLSLSAVPFELVQQSRDVSEAKQKVWHKQRLDDYILGQRSIRVFDAFW